MNTLHLARCLGDITTPAFQRHYYRRQLESLDHDTSILFNRRPPTSENNEVSPEPAIAHRAGTNCLAVDQTQGRYLVSGGADTFIRLWDLEAPVTTIDTDATSYSNPNPTKRRVQTHHAISSISKATTLSHTHSITSLSIYPHDPTPQTLLTTSYDHSLLLTTITPTSLVPLHSFPLDFPVHTHATSPHPSSPLVAVGTSHPSPRLIDLRTALSTHSLPGHNGAIYSLAWHPRREHTLLTSSTDGRILSFDIRRATPAFCTFSLDDSLGITNTNATRRHLDFSHRAHDAPITGLLFTESGDKLISAAQDQRIRVWDVTSGRSDLVHFGPRIRNPVGREGELKPVLVPRGMGGGCGGERGRDVLLWPNNGDVVGGSGNGEILVCEIREGELRGVLKTKMIKSVGGGASLGVGSGRGAGVSAGSNITLTAPGSRGHPPRPGRGTRPHPASHAHTHTRPLRAQPPSRVNTLAFRPVLSDTGLGGPLEMFSAHSDGRICAWSTRATNTTADDDDDDERGGYGDQQGDEDDEDDDGGEDGNGERDKRTEEDKAVERSRKRKREMLEGLVGGLTGRNVTFS